MKNQCDEDDKPQGEKQASGSRRVDGVKSWREADALRKRMNSWVLFQQRQMCCDNVSSVKISTIHLIEELSSIDKNTRNSEGQCNSPTTTLNLLYRFNSPIVIKPPLVSSAPLSPLPCTFTRWRMVSQKSSSFVILFVFDTGGQPSSLRRAVITTAGCYMNESAVINYALHDNVSPSLFGQLSDISHSAAGAFDLWDERMSCNCRETL